MNTQSLLCSVNKGTYKETCSKGVKHSLSIIINSISRDIIKDLPV